MRGGERLLLAVLCAVALGACRPDAKATCRRLATLCPSPDDQASCEAALGAMSAGDARDAANCIEDSAGCDRAARCLVHGQRGSGWGDVTRPLSD